jgi:hypothetical protein
MFFFGTIFSYFDFEYNTNLQRVPVRSRDSFVCHMTITNKMSTGARDHGLINSTTNLVGSTNDQYKPWSHKEYTLYGRRWFIVFVVCVINIANAMVRYEHSFESDVYSCRVSEFI